MKRLVLLDAYALIYRAFYALMRSPRMNSKGFNTATIMGFVNTLEEILKKQDPTHIAVAFDPKGGTFRHEAYAEYKAQREKQPEGIAESVPIIKQILKAYNIPIYEVDGYEADDVIGTLARNAEEKGFDVLMVTPDKDYCQLVTEKSHICRPPHGKGDYEIMGPAEVIQKYELSSPSQVIDMLGLMGDASDNVPGCPGVGPKTAISLINQYGSIEGIYENLDSIKGKLRDNLEQNKEKVEFSKFLVTIHTQVPLEFDEDLLARKDINKDQLTNIFEELEFYQLLKRVCGVTREDKPKSTILATPNLFINEKKEYPVSQITTNYGIVDSSNREAMLQLFLQSEHVSIAFAVSNGSALDADVWGISLCKTPGEVCFFSIDSTKGESTDDFLKSFAPLFENNQIGKVGYDMKWIYLMLASHHICLNGPLFDIMLAHYVIQPEQRHFLEYLVDVYLHQTIISKDNKAGDNMGLLGMMFVNAEELAPRPNQEADYCMRLKQILEEEMERVNARSLFDNIEMPLVPVLAQMELNGVLIDTSVMGEISKTFAERLHEYEQTIFSISGEEFNISSPRQVGEILFDKMKLDEKAKRTKSGQYETSEAVLEALRGKNPIIEQILNYRAMKKLLSTYVDALPNLINYHTRHIHTTFNQAITATGRLSSSEPNLQNIPVRGSDGKEIRKAFVPEPGCEFFSADYSQIELRILAHLSNDEQMIAAFREGHDIHTATAAKIYHKPIEEVTTEERRKAKTANFGIVYGITTFGLSQRIGISRSEAKELIENYFATFHRIKSYMEEIVAQAQQQGYVETIFHRRRYLPEINSQNKNVRSFAERNAMNAPIQGSAADIIKIAMINIAKRFKEEGIKSKMTIQVHDELNFSVYPEEKQQVQNIVTQEMANACELQVPLVADFGFGKNWLEAH